MSSLAEVRSLELARVASTQATQVQLTKRTATRCRAAIAIALILAVALVTGTYINARWGGPTSIVMTPDSESAEIRPPSGPRYEKDWEAGGAGGQRI